VVKRALGIDVGELDKRFRTWLTPRLARYDKQFVPDLRAPSLEEAKKAAKAAPENVRVQVDLVLAQLAEGNGNEAEATLNSLRRKHPKDPTAAYLHARLLVGQKKYDQASKLLEQVVANGHDGYAARIRLAELAEQKKDIKAERAHLEAARRFDPTQVEALQGLYDLSMKEKRNGDALAVLRELSVLDQHEPRVAVRLLDMLVGAERWQEAIKVGPRAIQLDLHNATVHQQYAQALSKEKQDDKAMFEQESARLCKPR